VRVLRSYADFGAGSLQMQWLQADLAKVGVISDLSR
jgi:hypothetical protein